MDNPLLKALAGEAVRPAPFWLMRQAGRYLLEYRKLRASAGSFQDLCFSPALRPGPPVFNLGHGVLPMTPPEHVAALRRIVREAP